MASRLQQTTSTLFSVTASAHTTLATAARYPELRYMGSKHRLLPWIFEVLSGLNFNFAMDPIFGQALRLFDIERRSLKEAAEIVSISLTGGDGLGKKEHQLFGEDGVESMVDRVASIEKTLGIYELAQFTSRI